MRKHILASSIALALLGACGSPTPGHLPPAAPTDSTASSRNVLVIGGTIRVAAPAWTLAQALYSEDGRVIAVGGEAEVRAVARAPYTTIDLAGAVAVPGLIDAHGHLEGLGESLEALDLRGIQSYAALIEVVARRAAEQPAGTWILGRGWDQNLWESGKFPHHMELSRRVADHPVLLERVDGHASLANARALEVAGLSRVQADEFPVPGGRMLLDSDGRPTGVFIDNAAALVGRHVPVPDLASRERRVLRAQEELFSKGLTGLHDMGEDFELAGILGRLSARGPLKLQVAGYLSQAAVESLEHDLPPGMTPPSGLKGSSTPTYNVHGAKLYMDGALGSRGAALLADYSDEPGNRGLAFLEPERLGELLTRCNGLRLQPAIHAIGDLGNRRVLDGFAALLAAEPTFAALRQRIEHAQVVSRDDWPRFLTLGVIPSMQPTHATSDMPWAPARLGAERVEGAYAWRRLDPSSLALAFGSDCPVELCDPLAGLYAAITCADPNGKPDQGYRPDQRLDAGVALAGYTLNAARAAHQESQFGSLLPGFFANLTVLDVDPLVCAPSELLGGGHVRMTIVRGEVVYRSARKVTLAREFAR